MATDVASLNPSPFAAKTEVTVGVTTGHVGSKNKNVGWFAKAIPELQSAARDLLENYSGIPKDKVIEHVLDIVSHIPNARVYTEEV